MASDFKKNIDSLAKEKRLSDTKIKSLIESELEAIAERIINESHS